MREQVMTDAIVANPRSHYGDAKASTRHFILQRVSGAINILFIALLVFVVVRLAGEDRAEMVQTVGSWWIGIPLALLILNVAAHMRNGMRDVLEDYLAGRTYRLVMMLNTIFCLAVALLGAGSVLKLVFWG